MITGNYRQRAELRKKPRRQFQYPAKLITSDGVQKSCTILDISHSGVRLTLDQAESITDTFILFLTRNGAAQRHCRVIWKTGDTVGVEFVNRPIS